MFYKKKTYYSFFVNMLFYVGVVRTLNIKYQKFMTCQLVNNIEFEKYIGDKT